MKIFHFRDINEHGSLLISCFCVAIAFCLSRGTLIASIGNGACGGGNEATIGAGSW